MTINQISIFLENKFGRLNEILSILSKENIRVLTATVADTSDYGILRLITSNQHKVIQLLKEHGVSANLNSVLAVSVDSSMEKSNSSQELVSASSICIVSLFQGRRS